MEEKALMRPRTVEKRLYELARRECGAPFIESRDLHPIRRGVEVRHVLR
jgi:hypothetical protein